MATPTSDPGQSMFCFQIVTADGSVVDTEPEPFPDLKAAINAADGWMKMKGQILQIVTYEGFGVTVRSEKIDLITAMPVEKMADIFAQRNELETPDV